MGIIKIGLLVSLIKLQGTVKPMSCALIYTSIAFVMGLFFKPFLFVLIGSVISFLLAWLYFWLLDKLEGTFFWWLVLIVGAFIGLV